jgi:hypothetical protein
MGTKRSKLLQDIPSEIRPLVTERNILACEDPKDYDNLLAALVKSFNPKGAMQWLNLKRLQDLLWEQLRMSRIKPGILESIQRKAVMSLLDSLPRQAKAAISNTGDYFSVEDHSASWFLNEAAKEHIEQVFELLNYSQNTIDAMAFVGRMDEL